MFMRILYAITAWSIMFYTYVCEAEEVVIYSFALPIVGTEHTRAKMNTKTLFSHTNLFRFPKEEGLVDLGSTTYGIWQARESNTGLPIDMLIYLKLIFK